MNSNATFSSHACRTNNVLECPSPRLYRLIVAGDRSVHYPNPVSNGANLQRIILASAIAVAKAIVVFKRLAARMEVTFR